MNTLFGYSIYTEKVATAILNQEFFTIIHLTLIKTDVSFPILQILDSFTVSKNFPSRIFLA